MTNERMTNEEAIEILENDIEICTIQQKQACDMAIKALESQRWIPVSERLPEDYIHVLCQFTLNGMGECYLAHGIFHVVGGVVMTCNEVIAWMPLPEPYKKNESQNTLEEDPRRCEKCIHFITRDSAGVVLCGSDAWECDFTPKEG